MSPSSAAGNPADDDPEYDYVVVGSGAGGGPVAANLAEAGYRTLLLEAGGDDESLNYQVPCFHATATEDESLRWDFFVRHYSDGDQQRRDSKYVPDRDGVLYPRAGTLGGCTAHNAMITVYPHNSDWDRIAQITGDRSWRSANMRRYFERLERCQYIRRPKMLPRNRLLAELLRRLPFFAYRFFNRGRHGFDGWLATDVADPKLAGRDLQLVRVILAAAESALAQFLGRPLTLLEGLNTFFDPNDFRVNARNPEGLWFVPLATSGGRRVSTRDRIRAVQSRVPDKLTVRTHALATRVLFEDRRAVGVEYVAAPHVYRADPRSSADGPLPPSQRVRARREVVLSGGAFNTPQLLKLSGVGPREELLRHGIDVLVDLPGVGENMQDRYEVGVISQMDHDFSLIEDCTFRTPGVGEEPDPCLKSWERGEGVYTTNGAVVAITERSRQDRPVPDLFIFGLPAYFPGYHPGYSAALEREKSYFTWAILKAHTRNNGGRVRLRSADPRDVPDVNFRYFQEGSDSEGDDLDAVVSGVELVRTIMRDAGSAVEREVVPGEEVRTREEIRQFVADEAWGHHASCTCKIGADGDGMAVLDSKFRVRGTQNLRVVDASVFPYIPGFFIVSAVYMIAEKASEVILAEAKAATPLLVRLREGVSGLTGTGGTPTRATTSSGRRA